MLNVCHAESAKLKHHHHHHEDAPLLPNPHSNLGPEERFARLLMVLEAQFGANIAPLERPRLPPHLLPNGALPNGKSASPAATTKSEAEHEESKLKEEDQSREDVDEDRIASLEAAELARLQALGIPVPGIEIKVDKHIARVWLENLDVECSNPVLRDRVRVVVERAVETVASMWAEGPPSASATNGSGKQGLHDTKGAEVETNA